MFIKRLRGMVCLQLRKSEKETRKKTTNKSELND